MTAATPECGPPSSMTDVSSSTVTQTTHEAATVTRTEADVSLALDTKSLEECNVNRRFCPFQWASKVSPKRALLQPLSAGLLTHQAVFFQKKSPTCARYSRYTLSILLKCVVAFFSAFYFFSLSADQESHPYRPAIYLLRPDSWA